MTMIIHECHHKNLKTSSTSQPSPKQHIFPKVPVKCLFVVRFSQFKVLQKAGTLLDTFGLESESSLCAKIKILQNRLS